ncbi:MAG: UvrD-helicase domain-containing protein, partial [Tepidimonas sp.]|uniref:UvrD-helicase domain-containing protein n=1 Tax=Tepidimonas sp. TaxID=2002775 RepID=UPI004054BD4C
MTPPVRDLCIETFPLIGSQLIEASAGTGKTWTIAMLYLRLVLGPHDSGVPAIARPLHPREILVVTFTEAATQELKDRIRQRLTDAATVFRDTARGPHEWPEPLRPVADLRALYAPARWPALAQRLQLAADAMDEAAIATLHSWCYRILREQAFASGAPFTLALAPDIADVVDEAVTDLWRLQYQPMPDELAESISSTWATPAALADAVRPLLPHAAHWDATEPALADATATDILTQALAEKRAALAALKAPWPEWLDAAQTVLQAHGLVKALGPPYAVRKWLTTLAEWARDPNDADAPPLGKGWERFCPDWLRAHYGSAPPPPDVAGLALWEAVPALQDALRALPSPQGRLLRHAAVWV